VAQFRVLGGLIGLAIAASISTPYIRSHIGQNLPPNLTQAILEKTGAIHLLPERSRIRVQEIFGEGYNIQMKLLIGFAAAQMPTTVLMWTNVVVSGREIPNR
jgi:hypothetical protein